MKCSGTSWACVAGFAIALAAQAQSPAERDLFDRVNQAREHAGLAKLEWNAKLAESARAHAQREAGHAQISHQFAGEPGLQERISTTGLRFDNCAENVARGPDVATIAAGLLLSSGHRENMLDRDFNAMGIGIVESNGELYVAENFARTFQVYSAAQFRDALIATLQHSRAANRAPELKVITDAAVEEAACSSGPEEAKKLSSRLTGWGSVMVFTDSDPTKLPDSWKPLTKESSIDRVALSVCFRPGDQSGYANFTVASVFYRD